MVTMSRSRFQTIQQSSLLALTGAGLATYCGLKWVLTSRVSQSKKAASCSDVHQLTLSERESMELATAELNREFDVLLAERKPQFGFSSRRKRAAVA